MIVFKVIYDMIGNKFWGCSMIKTHFKYLLINTKHVHVFVVVMQNQIKYGDRTYILDQFIEAALEEQPLQQPQLLHGQNKFQRLLAES